MIRLALLAVLTGCAATALPGAGPTQACSADRLAALRGKRASTAVVAKAKLVSGAKTVRIIPAGMLVTMEYRPDRLNIDLNEGRRITALHCG